MTDAYETIRQTLLDEHGGHIGRAFEDACRRLVVEYAHAEKIDGELAAWKRGASLAFLRSQGKPNREPTPAPPAIVDPGPDEVVGYPVRH
jgi:hypothetical protein